MINDIKFLKTIGVFQPEELEKVYIKLSDLHLRMRQFNLRMSFTLRWKASGNPSFKSEIRDINHKMLSTQTADSLNQLLHKMLLFVETKFIKKADELKDLTYFNLDPKHHGPNPDTPLPSPS